MRNNSEFFEMYREYLRIIAEKCTEEEYISIANEIFALPHYKIDDGLHVYSSEDFAHIIISNRELQSVDNKAVFLELEGTTIGMKMYEDRKHYGIISYSMKEYERENFQNKGKDYYFLPPNIKEDNCQDKCEFFGYSTTDMIGVLGNTNTQDKETKQIYDEAIELYARVLEIVNEKRKPIGDINSLSEEELERLFHETIQDNERKRAELQELSPKRSINK